METESTNIPLAAARRDDYSAQGLKIYALLKFLKEKTAFPYRQLVEQSKKWAETNVIPPGWIKPLANPEELSNAQRKQKPSNVKIAAARVKQIYQLLEKMSELYGYRIKAILKTQETYLKVKYERVDSHAEIMERVNPNRENLTSMGLVDVISDKPIQDADFQAAIMEAAEVRILQSAFYKNHLILETLSHAIEKGKLRTIKVLLAQPYSQAARDRAHTYNLKGEEQYAFFNTNVLEAISGLVSIREESRGEDNVPTVNIELGLYSISPVIPIYQCLDEKGNNLLLLTGIFWRNHSSFYRPHFKIKGNRGPLLAAVTSHFNEIMADSEASEDRFNWQLLMEKRRTVKVELEYDEVERIKLFLKEANQLSMFFPQGPDRPIQWTYFKCFYYNFKNEERDFLLKVDTRNNVACIIKTHNDSSYSGVIVRLHSNYTLFLHSTNLKRNNRIITLSIPVGGTDLIDNQQRFAIYSNNDVDSGSPYSQMMLLMRFDVPPNLHEDDEKFAELYKKVDVVREEYAPYLKERKIHLRSELWYKTDLRVEQVPNNYYQYFQPRDRDKYFTLLMRELKNAKSEIYFLGYAPETNANDEQEATIKAYYDLHYQLIEEKNIKIHRILLDRGSVNGKFKAYLKEMFSCEENPNNFRLYAANTRIPILNDTILIDPESPDGNKIAILSYMQKRKGDAGSIPNRLEVIKENPTIVENLHNTCMEFIELKGTVMRYGSLAAFTGADK